MSWTVEIVTVPIADDVERAWVQLEGLREEADAREYGAAPSDVLAEFYRRLTVRYPCITVDPDSPWSDGPLINNFGDKVATIGIITPRLPEALPFVIETATDMGLTVFDAGDERIHRPRGWIARPAASTPEASAGNPWWRFWR
jgi:hypothetical protein